MCEPAVISGGRFGGLRFAGTGLSVAEHQARTVANYLQLRTLVPDLPFIPVLQGWDRPTTCGVCELYTAAGVDLTAAPLVGLGSVCRRQSTTEIVRQDSRGPVEWWRSAREVFRHRTGDQPRGSRAYRSTLLPSGSRTVASRCPHGASNGSWALSNPASVSSR
jgi:hypothetical protein